MAPVRYEGRHVTVWDRDEPQWRAGCAWLVIVLLIGVSIGFMIGSCTAPRTAPSTTPSSPPAQSSDLRATDRPTPQPTAEPVIGSARTSAMRSVAPRTLPTQGPAQTVLEGLATWYDDGPGLYAAVNSFRWGDRPYDVTICLARGEYRGTVCVMATVRDHCYCLVNGERRLIDLSPQAFAKLAPLGSGEVVVEVSR